MEVMKSIVGSILVEKYTTQEIADKRISVCETCSKRQGDKCGICGCFYELKAEMEFNKNPKKFFRIEETHCPLGKWGDVEIANRYREKDGKPLLIFI